MEENITTVSDEPVAEIIVTDYQLIEKDKATLVEKIKQLDAELHTLETNYFTKSENRTGGCNVIRGWESFLDAKLDGSNGGRGLKVPQAERYFSNTSLKSTYSSGVVIGQATSDEEGKDIGSSSRNKGTKINRSNNGANNSNTSRTRKDGRKRKRY